MATTTPITRLSGLVRAAVGLYVQSLGEVGDAADQPSIPSEIMAIQSISSATTIRNWETVLTAMKIGLQLKRGNQMVIVDLASASSEAQATGAKRIHAIYTRAYAEAPATKRLRGPALAAAADAPVRAYIQARRIRLAQLGPNDMRAAADAAEAKGSFVERVLRAVVQARSLSAMEIQAVTGVSSRTTNDIVTADRTRAMSICQSVLSSMDWNPVLLIGDAAILCSWGGGETKAQLPVEGVRRRSTALKAE